MTHTQYQACSQRSSVSRDPFEVTHLRASTRPHTEERSACFNRVRNPEVTLEVQVTDQGAVTISEGDVGSMEAAAGPIEITGGEVLSDVRLAIILIT